MTHDNVTDIVERLVAEKYESDEHGIWAIPRNPEGREAAQVIETLRKQLENARSEALEKAEAAVVGTNADGDRDALSAYQKCISAIHKLKGQP